MTYPLEWKYMAYVCSDVNKWTNGAEDTDFPQNSMVLHVWNKC